MKLYSLLPISKLALPLFSHAVRAGFPSPADDHQELSLDLNDHLIIHPSATYFAWAEGDSMMAYGIHPKDLLVIDRALEAQNGDVVIAAINGELTVKVLDRKGRQLLSGNSKYKPIPIRDEMDLIIEGVVTCSIRYHRCLR